LALHAACSAPAVNAVASASGARAVVGAIIRAFPCLAALTSELGIALTLSGSTEALEAALLVARVVGAIVAAETLVAIAEPREAFAMSRALCTLLSNGADLDAAIISVPPGLAVADTAVAIPVQGAVVLGIWGT